MTPHDSTERLVDVVALLLRTRVPLTHREISERLGWVYGGEDGGDLRRRLFDRDKERLRAWGYELDMTWRPEDEGAASYRIRPDGFFLHAAGLTPEEQFALRIAAAGAVDQSGRGAGAAVDKLGGREAHGGGLRWSDPGLLVCGELLRAVSVRAVVTFRYRDGAGTVSRRRVEPWGLLSQDGYWYLVCWDLDRGERRTLRVDRVDGTVRAGDPGSATVPAPEGGLGGVLDPDPKMLGDGPLAVVTVAVHPEFLARAVGGPGGGGVTGQVASGGPEDGWPLVEVSYRNDDALRSWLIGLGASAKVVSPAVVASWYAASMGW